MKFNETTKNKTKVLNHENDIVYQIGLKNELYSLITTFLYEDKYYESTQTQLLRLRELIKRCDIEFILKLAIYAREEMYLRTAPIVLICEALKINSGNNLISKTITRIIQRVDQITEFLAYYQSMNNRTGTKKLNKLSNQLKKGIAESFKKFDEYQFSKYNRKTEIKIKDALFLTHVKPDNEDQENLFKKIANDNLETPYTWEVEISDKGNKKEVWESLILSGKLGYMATLRNLRNILLCDVKKECIEKVCEYISNPAAVKKSKQFPFRFFSAYKELLGIGTFNINSIFDALESAIQISIDNIDFFDKNDRCLIACDVSGSMQRPISKNSKIQSYEIGLLLGQLLQKKLNFIINGFFGDVWKIKNLAGKNILANTMALRNNEGEVGYSTNGYKVLEFIVANNIKLDKIIMFTDCQLWNSLGGKKDLYVAYWHQIKRINPEVKLFLFDLSGYGTTPVSILQKDVYFISGWSDKIFNIINAIDNKNDAIKMIEEIQL